MKYPVPAWYGICSNFMRQAAASILLIDILVSTDPTITASLAVASSARGKRKPLKKADCLNMAFLIDMYNWTASFL